MDECRGEVQHNKSRVQGAEKGAAGEGLGHRPHSCNDNRQQLQSKKLNMQNEAIERERAGKRGSGERAAVPASQAVIQSGYNYLSPAKGGRGEWQAGCQRRQRLPQHCNFDVLATGWLRHSGTTTTTTATMMWACSVLCEVNS